jgi:hypothetical protein
VSAAWHHAYRALGITASRFRLYCLSCAACPAPRSYTLLLSPDAFDCAQPVTVVTNGRVSFQGKVETSVATLLKWAATDDDRTMLFGAELHVK